MVKRSAVVQLFLLSAMATLGRSGCVLNIRSWVRIPLPPLEKEIVGENFQDVIHLKLKV